MEQRTNKRMRPLGLVPSAAIERHNKMLTNFLTYKPFIPLNQLDQGIVVYKFDIELPFLVTPGEEVIFYSINRAFCVFQGIAGSPIDTVLDEYRTISFASKALPLPPMIWTILSDKT